MDKEIEEKGRQGQVPLVSIFTLTYNHAPYIRQCLDGFLMQKTDFPFEVIINDDASTDGTTEIVREYEKKYPEIIKPIYHSENCFSKGERGFWNRYCLPKSRGKYIALCEGDDYWIDPLKLQKQVDFLEANPEYTLSHTKFQFYIQEDSSYIDHGDAFILRKSDKKGVMLNVLRNNRYRIQTNTVLFRKNDYVAVIDSDPFLYKSNHFLMGDTQLWIGLLQKGKIYYLKDCTAIYRVHKGSACRMVSCRDKFRFNLSVAEMRIYLIRKLKLKGFNVLLFYVSIVKSYLITLFCVLSLDSNFSLKYKPFPVIYNSCSLLCRFQVIRRLVCRILLKTK